MPLKKGTSKSIIRDNIDTLMHEVGKSPHVQSKKQAVAIAYSKARKTKKHANYSSKAIEEVSKKLK